jgi:spore germination protein GerM
VRVTHLAGVTAVVAVMLSSCGVPDDGDLQVIDREAVPFGLLDEQGGNPGADEGGVTVDLHLVTGDPPALVPVSRRIGEPTLDRVLAALADLPTTGEEALGLRNPVSDGDVLADVSLEGGIATVDLTEDFSSLSGTDELLAIGQVVLTLTARPGVGRVAFTLDGERVEVPRGDGSLTSGSVSRDTYAGLLEGEVPA